ncbi:MAG: GNAT family N-acetyltransferase [Pseudomonadota bacterium]
MITYTDEEPIDTDQFLSLLHRSGLAERRPVDSRKTIASMVLNADVLMTAWEGDDLIGIARSVTDFAYCCYLSDLAVDQRLQKQGVGEELMRRTAARLAPDCQIILLAAPAAAAYYPAQGFSPHDSCWIRPARSFEAVG